MASLPSASLRSLICTQQLPRPSSSAASCMMIVAMEQSSTQTSVFVVSAATTMAAAAPSISAAPDALLTDKALSVSLSSTRMKSQGLMRCPDGDNFAASKIYSKDFLSITSSVKRRHVRLLFNNSRKFFM